MKVLLTGATGFLGAHLCVALLQRGFDVRALKRSGSNMSEFLMVCKKYAVSDELHTHIEWIECDILDTFAPPVVYWPQPAYR